MMISFIMGLIKTTASANSFLKVSFLELSIYYSVVRMSVSMMAFVSEQSKVTFFKLLLFPYITNFLSSKLTLLL